jgi:alkaline phosphatase
MKHFTPAVLLIISTLTTACSSSSTESESKGVSPKNIIMIVGDGMGPAYTSAYRYFHDDPTTTEIEETVFDRHLVGLSSTYPARESGYVTDSAAGATALATGVKSYNGAIAVDTDKNNVLTVLEWAKSQGKKTGVVVTSQVNHATPASYLSHNESRRNYNAIANSYIDDGIKADVILGGGWKYFIREDRNLVNEFKQAGFHYIDNYQQLTNIPQDKPVLGLFADVGLPWALDDKNPHRLLAMTQAATKQLENPNGYFMLVEASQIDWAGHSNDIASAMAEMDDLAKTLEYLEDYVKNNPDTLVVVTADHSTGGFTIGADGKYLWQPEILRETKHSSKAIAKHFAKDDISQFNQQNLLPFTLTSEELDNLATRKKSVQENLAKYNQLTEDEQKEQKEPSVERVLYKTINHIIDSRTVTGWTSGGHTGIDVPVFSFGAQSENFTGYQDNTDIAKGIFKLLGKTQ